MAGTVEYEDVTRQLQRLAALQTGSKKVVRRGVTAHLKVGERGIAAAANVFDHGSPRTRVVNNHYVDPGGLGASIGSRLNKPSAATIDGKVGMAVGKSPVPLGTQVQKGSKVAVRYGHLVILGTTARWTGSKARLNKKTGRVKVTATGSPVQYRGIGPAFHFVEEGYSRVASQADQAAYDVMEKDLRKIETTGSAL